MQGDDLAGDLLDGADALLEVAARMGCLAGHVTDHEHAALAAGHDRAGRAARLGVEDRPCAPRFGLDYRARGWRADLFVRREQADQRRRRAAEFLEGGE